MSGGCWVRWRLPGAWLYFWLIPACGGPASVRVDQLRGDSTRRIGIHIAVAARPLLADVAPRARLHYPVSEVLVSADGLVEVVDRQAQVVNAFAVRLQKIGITVRRVLRRDDPLKLELVYRCQPTSNGSRSGLPW